MCSKLRTVQTTSCPRYTTTTHAKEFFSEDKWPISSLQTGLKELVCTSIVQIICVYIIWQDGSIADPLHVWKIAPEENPLVKLSILIFSFVPNSTSTECLFSSMADIKTKKWNWLGVQKLRDCALSCRR